jgi:GNAT superfamily N-acetyltransferase
MDLICFPADEPYPIDDSASWWTAKDENGSLAGYCGAKIWHPDNAVYLCRAGVLQHARGNKLQLRMIKTRLTWAKKTGLSQAITYTLPSNPASSNNLIRCGFETFEPSYKWGGCEPIYWIKKL